MTDQDAKALYSVLKRLWDERSDDMGSVIYPSMEMAEEVTSILDELVEEFKNA